MSVFDEAGANRLTVGIPILMYHEIAGHQETSSRLAVSPESFAAQLNHLHEVGFSTLTISKVASALVKDSVQLPERAVAITFDDGFADFHSNALPCYVSMASQPWSS